MTNSLTPSVVRVLQCAMRLTNFKTQDNFSQIYTQKLFINSAHLYQPEVIAQVKHKLSIM